MDMDIDLVKNCLFPTPYYIVDEKLVIRNLEILHSIIDRTNCKILLAQKAFSMFSLYPLIGQYLSGTTASGLYEAKLGYEEMMKSGDMKKENHVFSPAYSDSEFDEILYICDYIVFNSFSQWNKFKDKAITANMKKKYGLRINPECSTQNHAIYDPCSKGSRLGITAATFEYECEKSKGETLEGISGLHFHTLCEQGADALIVTVKAVEEKFGKWLSSEQVKWLNIGGGHHITRKDYDINALVDCVNYLKEKYKLEIYIEPGEAVVLNTGFLVASVLDIVQNKNDIEIAILDTSAACHMPDVLEMPYRPETIRASPTTNDTYDIVPTNKTYTYRLGGATCLAGDVIGDYSFDKPLHVGDKLIFGDMAHYSMVKNNTFNGMPLPSIVIKNAEGDFKMVKKFGYDDFKNRLS